MTNLAPRAGIALAAASLLLTAGCLEDKAGDPASLCGGGDLVTVDSADFCVFSSALIIEGFRCPEAFPNGFPGGGGAMVCADDEDLDDDVIASIIEQWGGSEPAGDVTDATDGDASTADTSTIDDVGPTPVEPTLCEASHDVEAGAYVAVAGQGSDCAVEEACSGAGLIVQCGQRLYCDCVFGDQICGAYDASGCPARGASLGSGCAPVVGADACEDDLYCQQGSPATCQALPEPCGATACFDATACADDEVCYGAAPFASEGPAQGGCAAPPATAGGCWADDDCPSSWTCNGGPTGCDACSGCDLDTQAPGACAAAAGTETALWFGAMDRQRGDLTAGVTPHWAVAAGYGGGGGSIWLPCPSYDLQVRDEPTGSWQPVASELDCDGGSLRELPEGITALAPLPIDDVGGREDRGWVWVRLKGTYYTGCQAGEGLSSCTSGPIERFSDAPVRLVSE